MEPTEPLKDGLHSRRIQKNLSQLLKSDEISEEEFHSLAEDGTLCSAALAHIPNCLHPLSRCTDEEYEAINAKFREIIRAYVFALRYCQAHELKYSSEVFEKSMKMQSEENYKMLLQAVFKIFDNLRYNMRAHYYFIANSVVYPILAEELKRTEAIVLLKLLRPLCRDDRFLRRLFQLDESEAFALEFAAHLKLALALKNPVLYESIIPSLEGKLVGLTHDDEENCFTMELSEEVLHPIRKEIAVSLDIVVPRRMKIKVMDNEVAFLGDRPWSRLASYGGFWLADISSFRSLTKEEELQAKNSTGEHKHIVAKLNLALKFFWALKMLGVLTDAVYISHSTLWWYFSEEAR